jgi:hypothetical protein
MYNKWGGEIITVEAVVHNTNQDTKLKKNENKETFIWRSFNSDCMLCCRETAHSIMMDNIQQQLKPIYDNYSQQLEIIKPFPKALLFIIDFFLSKIMQGSNKFNIQSDNALLETSLISFL